MIASRLVVIVAAACAALPRAATTQQRDTTRRWENGSWRSLGELTGGAGGLDHPISLALAGNTLYVFNAGPGTVLALALDGHVRWRYTPPDSLRFHVDRVVSLAPGVDGGVWAADPNAGRCTIISPLGAVERVIPLHDSPHLAPRPDGSFWKASFIGVRPSLFDARGVRVRALRLPRTLTAPKDAVGDALLAMTGDTLVVAYVDAGRFLIAPPHAHRQVRDVWSVEPRPFPRFRESDVVIRGRTVHTYKAGPDAPPATLALAVDSGIIYSLYWNGRNAPGDRGRTVDMYRVSTGVYEGSRRLPLPSSAIAVRGDVVYALTDGGDLHIWRWAAAKPRPR